MLVLKQRLQQHNLTQSAVAARLGISDAALAQIVNHNQWPRQNGKVLKAAICALLAEKGIASEGCFRVVRNDKHIARTGTATTDLIHEEENMLLKKQVLIPQAKKLFGLFRSPFDDTAVQSAEDVFMTPDIRYVREAMYQTASYGGFLAIIGESGSGKSTLRRDLIDRTQREDAPILVIEPYVLAMEDNDRTGKTLKAANIAEAILSTVAPLERPKQSPEARFRQLHKILKDSARAGYNHTLIIEEAHSLPVPTLKHLKRFFELEDGFKKLISIILIGQPELALKLSERSADVREVVQRCEVVNLPPLDANLEAFLAFKFQKAGSDVNKVLDASAIDAIRARLNLHRAGAKAPISLLYPLSVGNLVTAAMNLAAVNDIGRVDKHIVNQLNKATL